MEDGSSPEQEEFLPHKSNGKKISQFTDFEGKTSFGMSVFNLSNAIMGSGILGLSYALSNTGIILFPILLTCIAVLSSYSIHLLLRSAGVVGIRAYEQLGKRALGHTGKILAAVVITMHNIGGELQCQIGYYCKWLTKIFHVDYRCSTQTERQLSSINYHSTNNKHGDIFFFPDDIYINFENVIYKKFNIPCPLQGFSNYTAVNISIDVECEAKYFTINQQTAYTVPILAFAFVCHPEVLPIYTELHNPTKRRMQAIANVSILGMFVMYLLTAIFGYLTFFANTEAELLHTYSKVDPLDTLILCVRLAVLVAVTLTVPVVLFPIRRALLQLLFPEKPFHWARHIFIAVCLLFFVNLLVIFVPNIRDIFGIIGATSAPSLIFILPGLFYIRIVPKDQEPTFSRPKIQAACFTALGFIFMSMSLTFIALDWINGENRSGGGH
uniref:Amino acid transporter transmembrane domain-containing protein n=1 Tax=Electrophorus electricus TaxID=8005 RepID=A0A4W4FIM9_ELEEL